MQPYYQNQPRLIVEKLKVYWICSVLIMRITARSLLTAGAALFLTCNYKNVRIYSESDV